MTSSDKNQKAQASGLFELWDLLRELSVYSTLVPPTLLATLSYVVGLLTWRQKKFTPDCDIPDLSGKVALITGANTGIGKETLLRLSKHGPAKIYLAARDEKKAQRAIAEIKDIVPKATITFIQMDLASFESIEKGAQRVTEECSRLDILILNAGIMATPWNTTKEGLEAQIGTNYVGHALLTKLLLPTLNKTAELVDSDVRIIIVSSIGHYMAPKGGIVFDQTVLKTLTPAQLYGQSKLANILHVKTLAKRYPNITSVAVHPGLIRTGLYEPVMKAIWLVKLAINTVGSFVFADVRYGALNQLWAATAPKETVKSGVYYMPIGKAICASKYTKDAELASQLWDWTEEQFKQHKISDKPKST